MVIYILLLAIRHRSLTLFTIANPGIPESGVAMESKSEILGAFGEGHPAIAPWKLLSAGLSADAKYAELETFARSSGFPLVLKPDVGERGLGVAIIANAEQAKRYLAACPHSVIAQEYVAGEEFGVFYVRHPDESCGRIISITEKRPLELVGDGESSLEQLILRDERAGCSAAFLLNRHAARLARVPTAGELVTVAELGTHARGAIFLDGGALCSASLERKIDRISKGSVRISMASTTGVTM